MNLNNLKRRWASELRHKQLSESTGAIAGLAAALSVFVGYLAAHAAPRGLHKLTMILHLSKKPLLVKIAPVLAGVTVAMASAAGLLHFYSWWLTRRSPEPDDEN